MFSLQKRGKRHEAIGILITLTLAITKQARLDQNRPYTLHTGTGSICSLPLIKLGYILIDFQL